MPAGAGGVRGSDADREVDAGVEDQEVGQRDQASRGGGGNGRRRKRAKQVLRDEGADGELATAGGDRTNT